MEICTDCDPVEKEESTPVLLKETMKVQSKFHEKMDDDNSYLLLKGNNIYHTISEKLLSILTHVFIMVCFATYFFFEYVIDIERKLLLEKLDDYFDKANDEYQEQEYEYKDDISRLYSRYNERSDYIYDNYKEAKHEQEVQLHKLTIKAISMVSFVAFFFFISLFNALWIRKYIHWKHILIENIVMFACLGIFEYLFFTWIIMNYSPINDAELQYIVYTNINEIINGTYSS